MEQPAPHCTRENNAFSLILRTGPPCEARLVAKEPGWLVCDAPYHLRAVTRVPQGRLDCSVPAACSVAGEGDALILTAQLAGLSVEVSFRLPAGRDWLEERVVLSNTGDEPVGLETFEAGFQHAFTDARFHVLPGHAADVFVPVPLRTRADGPPGTPLDVTFADLLTQWGGEQLGLDPFPQFRRPSPHRYSEAWAWTHASSALGIYKFNQEAIEYSALSLRSFPDHAAVRFGGAVLMGDEPERLVRMAPGARIELGVTRYEVFDGGHLPVYYGYRRFLDAQGCRFPAGFNPPVHWNEIYDNAEWFLACGEHREKPLMRPATYTKAHMEAEAAKARSYGCEALYMDPGWDTEFGTFLWGEEWLGPRKAFVDAMRADYGLQVSLHCPVAPWTSIEKRGVHAWPKESRRTDREGHVIEHSICLGSEAYRAEAVRRLAEHCDDGVTFVMLDGTWWIGTCYNPDHGHPVPYTREDHCRANLDIARRLHARHPECLIEMHDMIAGGSHIRYTPVYYKYGLPGSYDENWGFELMWNTLDDVMSGRASCLFYYNLGCNVPTYLHIDLRDDNAHCLVLWWFASTNRHLGIGGTHPDPMIAEAQRRAMQQYRALKPYYAHGEFHAMEQAGIAGPARPEEFHLHVLPDQRSLVVNVFNLSDTPRRMTAGVPLEALGLPRDAWYHLPKGCGINPATGWFHVDRHVPAWGAFLAEMRAIDAP